MLVSPLSPLTQPSYGAAQPHILVPPLSPPPLLSLPVQLPLPHPGMNSHPPSLLPAPQLPLGYTTPIPASSRQIAVGRGQHMGRKGRVGPRKYKALRITLTAEFFTPIQTSGCTAVLRLSFRLLFKRILQSA